MIAATPGNAGWRRRGGSAGRRARTLGAAADAAAAAPPAARCGGRAAAPPLPARSAVSATITDLTPGTARIAASARSRTASQVLTAAASTVIEKNTLPSLATISDSFPVAGSGEPSGLGTLPRPRERRP